MDQSRARSNGGHGGYRGGRVVGNYIFGRQIGSGSFSVVWHARHRVHGTEVAVKEMVMERLSDKLQESLLSEIQILRRIHHPNIIALHDIIQASRRVFLILEYCRGGDLSMYIQRHGRVPEATAKHFMQQLATGLQVLRENNLIHRDLKPQNLLLSTNDENSILKIADFGFARSLQPHGLAETLCGSPLYMAPEIMQHQKYDAKADLWSVGAILFQLVTGKTPFTGNNQTQLFENIVKSNELRFPPDNNLTYDCIDLCQKLLRRNPVQRLTFEEFFNHQFLSRNPADESLSQTSTNRRESYRSIEYSPSRNSGESLQEDCLPFPLDDESSRHDGSPSTPMAKASMRSTYGISADNRIDKILACSPSISTDIVSIYNSAYKHEFSHSKCDPHSPLDANVKEPKLAADQKAKKPFCKDSLELVDQDYVIVPSPPLEMSSLSVSASQTSNSPGKSDMSITVSPKLSMLSAPMPIVGIAARNTCAVGSLENHGSPASGTSQGSMDMGDAFEQPSTHCMTRIRSLQRCASVVTRLVKEKIENGRLLEAFSVQLVILAIRKQALHICLTQATSALEGSSSPDDGNRQFYEKDAVCSQIEREFLVEVGCAEELARDLGQIDETTEMPDAMEMIYQSALTLGRQGGVDETMDKLERASILYSRAVDLLYFLLVEAPSLIINPPFILTNSDRYRLRLYIDILSNRQNQSQSQRMALLKNEVL